MHMRYETRNDEATRCTFCSNACSRTFIDTETPSGQVSRYISGFSCEKGLVESKEAMKAIARATSLKCKATPNLVHEASKLVFSSFEFEPLPQEGHIIEEEVEVAGRSLLGFKRRRTEIRRRPFERPPPDALERRRSLRVGIPKTLTLYHCAHFFSTFFRTLGVGKVVFSNTTSDKLWEEGGKWGTIDPCFPSKVANAHVHNLLRKKDVDAIFFPMISHLESHLEEVRGSTACTVQTATPEVVYASFTKEKDYFKEAGVEYWKPLLNMERRSECAAGLHEYFEDRLDVTRDEVEHACRQGFRAMEAYRRKLRQKGRESIDRAVREHDIVVVGIGRPYHNDPGINHGILRQFQLRGYPVIGVESIPVDEAFLLPLFRDGAGRVDTAAMKGVLDVWKRAYNYGANNKLWVAKVIARHPNLVGIDFSCFKCGYDCSISGYMENIAESVRSPYFVFHDLDQKKSAAALDLRISSIAYFLDQLRNDLKAGSSLRPGTHVEARA
ncbi:MAG: hypothetical protein JRG91_13140 [Deltaproteobacteria bacterium]|nr:hypothetical protein [Deltaproteobacteria bacterium]